MINRDDHDRLAFLKARKNGIGGSDIAAILGVSKFKTAVDVYLAKTNPNPQEDNAEHLYWGHALEAPIARRFAQETGLEIMLNPPITQHSEYEWAIGNADGLILSAGKIDGILEIKTSSAYNTREWGAENSDEVPMAYIAQVQWYMGIFDVAYSYLAVLIGGNQYKHYRLERDQELIELLLSRAADFWQNHVQAGVPPEPANANDVFRLYPNDDGNTVEADTETLIVYNELKSLKQQEKEIKQQIEAHEELLKTKIGSHATMQIDGNAIFTWKAQSTNRFDSKAFKAAYPDLYQSFTKTTQSRILRLK